MLDDPRSIIRAAAWRAAGGTVSAHQRLQRCADISAETANAYVAAWSVFHQAGLHAMLQVQDACLQASQATLEAALRATPLARAERPRRLWPEASIKLSAGGTELLPGTPQPTASDDTSGTDDWMDSALRFPGSLGILFSELEEPDDRVDEDR